MDYGYADRATVEWSESQGRFELIIFEGAHILYRWILSAGFRSPSSEIQTGWIGVEEINARLADAKIYPSGANAWLLNGTGIWTRELTKRRERNANDH